MGTPSADSNMLFCGNPWYAECRVPTHIFPPLQFTLQSDAESQTQKYKRRSVYNPQKALPVEYRTLTAGVLTIVLWSEETREIIQDRSWV